MKTKWVKLAASLGLVVAIVGAGLSQPVRAGSAVPTPADSATAAAVTGKAKTKDSKEEVVYANLTGSGGVSQVYVVNQFEVSAGGELTDYGRYSSVENLTSTALLTQSGDAVSAPVEKGTFSYQGNLESDALPWLFSLSYQLDGQPIEAGELAGKSGKLEIRLHTRANPAVDETFFDNYMLQITQTFDGNKAADIISEDATIANAGKNKVVTHTVMPGKEGDITVKADVTDFSMAGIEIAAMPFSMAVDIPDTDEMTGEMVTLADAIDALDAGVGELAAGVGELNSGVAAMVDGSEEFAGGLNALSQNSGQLVDGSARIQDGLDAITSALGGQNTDFDLGDMAQLPTGLRQIAQGLLAMADNTNGLGALKNGYAQMYGTLDAAILNLASKSVDIAALATAINSMSDGPDKNAALAALGQLQDYYTAGQTLTGTYTTDMGGGSIQSGMAAVTGALEGTLQGLGTMAATLNMMADGIEDAMSDLDKLKDFSALVDGLSQLSSQYGEFHQGLVAYTGGVGQIAAGYGELNSGVASLGEGTAELAGGTRELHDGTSELNGAVADLPDTIEVEIDKLMSDYDKSDFTPVSFSSDKNDAPSLVQFVFMTEGITAPEKAAPAVEEEEPETLWDRLVALFQ